MIGAHEIERAENVLSVVYGGDLGRQLEALQVQREAVDNVIQHVWDVIDARIPERAAMSGQLTASMNTALLHMLLIGIVAGRNAARGLD